MTSWRFSLLSSPLSVPRHCITHLVVFSLSLRYHPKLSGYPPNPRGYHAACASPDGTRVYLFGGIAESDCCNTLAGEIVLCTLTDQRVQCSYWMKMCQRFCRQANKSFIIIAYKHLKNVFSSCTLERRPFPTVYLICSYRRRVLVL